MSETKDETTKAGPDESKELELELQRLRDEVRTRMDAADTRIVENADGTLIVKLLEPITFDGTELSRVTIQRVKVRHARATRHAERETEAYAEQLLLPAGVLDELAAEADYLAVMRATERALGKFRAAGEVT